MIPKAAAFSQSTQLEKTPKKPGKPEALGRLDPVQVSLISKPTKSALVAEKISDAECLAPVEDHVAFIKSASKMALRTRYWAEANSHRNMKARAKKYGKIVSPAIADFRDFLLLVGPMPSPGMTLDRKNNDDPEYAPAKVRWATAKVQNNNKGDTLTFTYSRNGMTFTTSQLSEHFNVTKDAIRKRRKEGWTDDEIIEGKRGYPKRTNNSAEDSHRASVAQSPSTSAASHSVPIRQSAREIAFQRMRERYVQHRSECGEEAFPAPLEVLNEGLQPGHKHYVPVEGYERKIRQLWPEHRPHVIFDNLPLSQQILIAKIDPEYVSDLERSHRGKIELACKL